MEPRYSEYAKLIISRHLVTLEQLFFLLYGNFGNKILGFFKNFLNISFDRNINLIF